MLINPNVKKIKGIMQMLNKVPIINSAKATYIDCLALNFTKRFVSFRKNSGPIIGSNIHITIPFKRTSLSFTYLLQSSEAFVCVFVCLCFP